MKRPKKHSFVEILTDSSVLYEIVNKVDHLAKLNHQIQQKLPSILSGACRIANLRQGTLFLVVDSPALSHQFRFLEAELLTVLQEQSEFIAIKSIQVLVQPQEEPKQTTILYPPTVSAQSAKTLQVAAETIDHNPLKKALLRLSEHGK